MAGGIKGITVKIGGDTTELGKALSSATKESTALQKELKGVNSLLKLDPTNFTLLKQKSDLLKESISETKKKLDSLKEVLAKADKGEIELTEAEYRNLQREIANTEIKLKDLKKQSKEFGSAFAQEISEAGKKLEKFGGKVEDVGKKFLPATGAVAGLATVAITTSATFDESMSQVSAISGATGEDLEALRDKAREMGSQTKFSASEAGDAMTYMAMAGWKTEDMIDGISGVMALASASGTDLATTSDILTDGLTAFGLSASDAGRMADVMASASANANTNVELLGESYKYCASTAGAMGFSLEDVTESLGLMANAGVKGSQAGTTLKNAMINLAKPSKDMAVVMDKYNISITNADGSMKSWNEIVGDLRTNLGGLSEAEQTNAVATLFGKEATAGMLSVINAGPADIEKLNGAINESTGVAQNMADTMNDNLTGQLTILKSQLEELAISFGEMLMPIIRDAVTWIQGLVDKLNNMSESQRQVIIVVLGVIAVIGPLLIVIGKLFGAIGTIMQVAPKIASGINAIGGGLKVLWGIISAHPVVFIVTAIIAVLVLLWTKCEWFREGVKALLEKIKEITETVVNAIVTFFTVTIPGAFTACKNWISDTFNAIKTTISNVWSAIKLATETTWNAIKKAIMTPIEGAKKIVKDAIEAIKGFFSFKITWPKIPMPHFSVKPSGWKIGDLLKGSIPTLGIDWYAKGGIFDRPTIIPTMSGLKGVGEAGPEAVAPIEVLQKYINEAVVDRNLAIENKLDQVINLMGNYYPDALNAMNRPVVVGVDTIDSALGDRNTRVERGW